MEKFHNKDGMQILAGMVEVIQENKAYLGDIDGLIGDGDHGMNMNKGFTLFAQRAKEKHLSFTDALDALGTVLFSEIGGSMGPIYGTIFMEMAEKGSDLEEIGLRELADMLQAGRDALFEIVDARVGDKTLVDTLDPALAALHTAQNQGLSFAQGLTNMKAAAAAGRDSTLNLTAKYGRASRLGERSMGVLDAGATSCCLLLTAMADQILSLLT